MGLIREENEENIFDLVKLSIKDRKLSIKDQQKNHKVSITNNLQMKSF